MRARLGGVWLPVGAEPPGMQVGASQAAKGATNTAVT